jgi:hypothetical protein
MRIPDQLLHCRYDVYLTLQVADAIYVVCELSSKHTVLIFWIIYRNWTAARVGIPAIVECSKLSNSTGFQIDWGPRSYEQRWPLDFQLEQAREYAVFANEASLCDSAIPQTGILAFCCRSPDVWISLWPRSWLKRCKPLVSGSGYFYLASKIHRSIAMASLLPTHLM